MSTDTIEIPVPTIPADDAPYGRRADGTARGKPGPKPKGTPSSSSGPAAGPPMPTRRPGGPRRPKAPAAKKTAQGPDYRPGIVGLLQIGSFPLVIAGKKNPTLALDASAVMLHAPGIAEALNQLAQERPEIAAALERVMQVGPYGVLIGALMPLAVQILTNHGKMPEAVATSMGAIPPTQLAQMSGAPVEEYRREEFAPNAS